MKELYASPEGKLFGFAPAEDLAANFDALLDDTTAQSGEISGTKIIDGLDIDLVI